MTHFHAGWNMPGYLPESDDGAFSYTTASDAKQSMLDDVLRHADSDDMADDHDNAEALSAMADDLNLNDVVNGWDGYSDRLHYWITPCSNEACLRDGR